MFIWTKKSDKIETEYVFQSKAFFFLSQKQSSHKLLQHL